MISLARQAQRGLKRSHRRIPEVKSEHTFTEVVGGRWHISWLTIKRWMKIVNVIKKIIARAVGEAGVMAAKKLLYARKGEPIEYGPHKLRYVPGTRPIRLSYRDAADVITRNDARQLQFFLDRVKTGDLVLDIGGHVGQYAVLFSSLAGEAGRVVTFEPDAAARKILLRNLALNSCGERVKVEGIALSDSDGTHSFFSRGGDSMSSLARSGLGNNAAALDVTEHVVTTMRLDDYLTRNGLGFPQWIKLDTEGAEINILRGARELLKSGAVIVCELHPYVWNEFGTTFEELLQLVRESGRTIRYLDEEQKIEHGAVYGATIIS